MSDKIRVFILDDHQSIIDGYTYRLSQHANIEIVGTANYGEDVEPMLARNPVDLAILDIQVYTSPDNPSPYPIIHLIPKLLQCYPDLSVLVISMFNQATLVKSVLDAGVSGYILKDDIKTLKNLGEVVGLVSKGGIYFSPLAYQQLSKKLPAEFSPTPRQLEMLSLCAAYPGETTAELARRMGIANSTARNILSQTYLRLVARNRTEAIDKARKLGWITPPEEMPGV